MKFLMAIICSVYFSSCLDIVTDNEFNLGNNVYIIYSEGDGYRLAESYDHKNYSDIIPSTIKELYKTKNAPFDFYAVKVDPIKSNENFTFYTLIIDSISASKYELNQITEQEYLLVIQTMHKVDLSKFH